MALMHMLQRNLESLGADRTKSYLFGVFIVAFALYYVWNSYQWKRLPYPVIGEQSELWFSKLRARTRYIFHGYDAIFTSIDKDPDRIYQVPNGHTNFLILPARYITELQSLPEEILSSSHAVSDYFLGRYTTLDLSMFGHVTWNVVRVCLTQQLNNIVEVLQSACVDAFEEEFPQSEEWTCVAIHATLLQIIGRITSQVFVGPEVGKNKDWLRASIGIATSIFQLSGRLKILPSWIRPIVAFLDPEFYRIKSYHRIARRILLPEICLRRETFKETPIHEEKQKTHSPGHDLFEQLILQESQASRQAPTQDLSIVKRQLGLSFAAVHTTTNHLTNVLIDLATYWEAHVTELREEIEAVEKSANGQLTKSSIAKLSKLDSFMKESQRLNPPSALSFNRKTMRSLTLSDGTVLPKSCYITVASGPIGQSGSQYCTPHTFDGFRFHRERIAGLSSVERSKHQFTTTNLSSLVFGSGKFACPGRFFASLESKIVLVHIIMHYDVSLGGHRQSRPKNLSFGDAHFPDPLQKLYFKRR